MRYRRFAVRREEARHGWRSAAHPTMDRAGRGYSPLDGVAAFGGVDDEGGARALIDGEGGLSAQADAGLHAGSVDGVFGLGYTSAADAGCVEAGVVGETE